MSILWLAAYLAGVAACLLTAAIAAVLLARRLLVPPRYDAARCTVAFFHPNANAGGGGERVLWMAIAALTDVHDRHRLKVVIYSGDADVSAAAAVLAARDRFGVNIPEDLDIELIYVARRYLLDPSRYPRLTMAGQSLGSMLLALDCVRAANPDVWIDTTGAAFTMVVAKVLAQCRTIAYVHYPTITTDMMERVHQRRATYNNDDRVSGSVVATNGKLAYYRAFAWAYGVMGGLHDAVMVNSSWTRDHIITLWRLPLPPSGRVAGRTGGAAVLDGAAGTLGGGDDGGTLRRRGGVSLRSHGSSRLEGMYGDGSDAVDDDAGEGSGGGVRAGSAALAAVAGAAGEYYRPATALLDIVLRALGSDPHRRRPSPRLIYPPCNTTLLAALPLQPRQRLIVSVAQFRPEKDHALQLHAMAAFRRLCEYALVPPQLRWLPVRTRLRPPFALLPAASAHADVRLVMIGGVRDEGDAGRVAALRVLAQQLQLAEVVDFRINIPLSELRQTLGMATAGLHTMWNEHFGIGIVEMQAAGVIPICHNSGGPRADIVQPGVTGFLAATPEEYAGALHAIFTADAAARGDDSATASGASTPPQLVLPALLGHRSAFRATGARGSRPPSTDAVTASPPLSAAASSAEESSVPPLALAAASPPTVGGAPSDVAAAGGSPVAEPAGSSITAAASTGSEAAAVTLAAGTAGSSLTATAKAAAVPAPPVDLLGMAAAARQSACERFSDEAFSLNFFAAVVAPIREGMDDARERRALGVDRD